MWTRTQTAIALTLRWLALMLCAVPARAEPSLCDRAARAAAADTGVPPALMQAIMLAETGRDLGQGRTAWPWTVQSQGQGHWLATPDQALALVRDLLAAGETNIDIGCFQINLRWHGRAFPSIEAMLDPETNARYAARYLLELHAQTGDWRSAAGAYHSRDATRAEAYVTRLVALHGETQGQAPTPEPGPRPAVRTGGPIIVLGSLAGPLIGGLR
ncbi:MAG: transglycosylase SLT domain-containing protein [Gemmobacter sp.]